MNKELDKKRCGANVEKVIIDEFVPSKAIDNSNPSEALEELDSGFEVHTKEYGNMIAYGEEQVDIIQQALLKAQEQEKENAEYKRVLEILKPCLRLVNNFLQARIPLLDIDRWVIVKEITDEKEHDLLKRWIEK